MTENTERVSERHGGENGNIDASRGVLTSEIQHEIDEEIEKTSSGGAISNEDIPEPVNVDVDKLETSSSCIEETPSAEACGIQKEEINGSEFDTTRPENLSQKMASSLQILDKEKDPKVNDSGDEVSDTLKTAASEDDEKISDDNSSGYTSELKQKNHRKKDDSIEMNSDFDLDYGIADPLEIARMVANEVEREVEDGMELSCSSSDKEMSSKVQQPDSSQVTKASQAVEISTDDGRCHFDLNQYVCLEDVEHPGDTFSRVPESNFALSACGNNSNLKGNRSLLNIDLNTAENESHQLASFESSAETSSRRSEVLEFDLNQISEDVAPLDPFCQRSVHQYESSSSSSSKQPSLINVDLNDQPRVANDLSNDFFSHNPSQSAFASGNVKSDDSVISIMGMRVEVNRRDSSVKHFPLPNGRVPERPIGLAMGSPASYAHHPHVFSLNGLPPGSSIPFHSPMYGYGGAIPHMVDSRGSSVVPQIMPSSAISSSFPQPPYLFTMPGMPSVNGVGFLRDTFDLNSGIYSEGSGRELGGFRQLFDPPQPRLFDERMKVNSPHPSTSLDIGVGGKRKESENVWESYPFKHHQQPWR